MLREVDSRKGETLDEIPMPARSGGWGVVVCGRESRLHGDAYPRQRPLAFGKTGTKVLSERASCTRGKSLYLWRLRKWEGTLRDVTERD
jgi:hypothetical protein